MQYASKVKIRATTKKKRGPHRTSVYTRPLYQTGPCTSSADPARLIYRATRSTVYAAFFYFSSSAMWYYHTLVRVFSDNSFLGDKPDRNLQFPRSSTSIENKTRVCSQMAGRFFKLRMYELGIIPMVLENQRKCVKLECLVRLEYFVCDESMSLLWMLQVVVFSVFYLSVD